MKPWQCAYRWHALFDNLIGAGTFFALALFWFTLSYRMMWFPICHYAGGVQQRVRQQSPSAQRRGRSVRG